MFPTGLGADGVAIVKGAKAAGVKVGLVNIMAMDYGDASAPNPGGKMGTYAIKSAKASRTELKAVFGKKAGRHLAVTPMIGINDVASEIFTLADARKLRRWARKNHLGGLSMWQLGRDSAVRDAVDDRPSSTARESRSSPGLSAARSADLAGSLCYQDEPEQPPLATLLVHERTTEGPSPLVMRKTLVDFETDVIT